MKDTRVYLNRKRVMEEQKIEYYMNENKKKRHPPDKKKMDNNDFNYQISKYLIRLESKFD